MSVPLLCSSGTLILRPMVGAMACEKGPILKGNQVFNFYACGRADLKFLVWGFSEIKYQNM